MSYLGLGIGNWELLSGGVEEGVYYLQVFCVLGIGLGNKVRGRSFFGCPDRLLPWVEFTGLRVGYLVVVSGES